MILMAGGSKVTDRRLLSFPCLSVKTMVLANRRLVAVLFSATMSRIWSSGPWALMLTPGEIPASCRLVNRLKMTNPYMTPRCTDGTEVIEFRATERPHAELIERKFLYRKVRITSPIDAILEYSGFSLHDRIWVNHRLMVCRLPWIWLTDLFKFDVQTDAGLMELQVRLGFHRFAQLKEFEIAVDGQVVYRERPTSGSGIKGPKS